jgi:hypothetical protein
MPCRARLAISARAAHGTAKKGFVAGQELNDGADFATMRARRRK